MSEKLVAEQLSDGRALIRIGLQHIDDHFRGGFAHSAGQSVVALADLRVCVLEALRFKWRLSSQERVHYAANGPNVDLIGVALLIEDLWSDVVRSTAEGFLAFSVVFDTSGQAKVADLYMQVVVQEEIAELEIAMDDFVVVKVLDAAHNLMDVITAFVFSNDLSALMQFHHGALFAQLEDDVNVERVVEEAVEAHNVPVVQGLMNLDLLSHLFLLVVLHHELL